jgi:hypothetical protein
MEKLFNGSEILETTRDRFEKCETPVHVLDMLEEMKKRTEDDLSEDFESVVEEIKEYFNKVKSGNKTRVGKIKIPTGSLDNTNYIDITKIVKEIAENIDIEPEGEAMVLRKKAQKSLKFRRYGQVIENLELIPGDERTPNDWYCLAHACDKKGDLVGALEAYQEANNDGRNGEERSNILEAQNKIVEKIKKRNKKLEKKKKPEQGNFKTAFEKKSYEQVIVKINEILEKDRSYEEWYMLAFSYEKTGDLEKALKAYEEAGASGIDEDQRREIIIAQERVGTKLKKQTGKNLEKQDKKVDNIEEKLLDVIDISAEEVKAISEKIQKQEPLSEEETKTAVFFIKKMVQNDLFPEKINFDDETKALVSFFKEQIEKVKELVVEIKNSNEKIKNIEKIEDLKKDIKELLESNDTQKEEKILEKEKEIGQLEKKIGPNSPSLEELKKENTERKKLLTEYAEGKKIGLSPEEQKETQKTKTVLEKKRQVSKDIRQNRQDLARLMLQKQNAKKHSLKNVFGKEKIDYDEQIREKQEQLEKSNQEFIELVGVNGEFIEKFLSKEQMLLTKKMSDLEKEAGKEGLGLGKICTKFHGALNYKPKWVKEKIDKINEEYPQNKTKRFLKTFKYNMMTPRGLITLGITGAAITAGVATGGLSFAALGAGMSTVYGTAGVLALNRTLSAFSSGMMVNMGFDALNVSKQSARLQTGMLEQNKASKIDRKLKKLEKTTESRAENKGEIADLERQREIEELKEKIKKVGKKGDKKELFSLENELDKKQKERLELASHDMSLGDLEEKINYYHALARDKKQSVQELFDSHGPKVKEAYKTLTSEYQKRIREKYSPENAEKAELNFEKIKEFANGKLAEQEKIIQETVKKEKNKKRIKTVTSVAAGVAAGSGFGVGYLVGGGIKNISAVVENVQTDGFDFSDLATGQGFKDQAIRQFQINDYLKESVCDLANENPILDFNTYQLEESLGLDSDNLEQSIPVMKELLDNNDPKARALLLDWESRGTLNKIEEFPNILTKDLNMIHLERDLGVNSFGDGVSSRELDRLRHLYHSGDQEKKGAIEHLVSIWQDSDENKINSDQAENLFKEPEPELDQAQLEDALENGQIPSLEQYEGQLEDATITTEGKHNSIIKIFQRQLESNEELKESVAEKLGLDKNISDNELANKLYYHHNPDGEDIWVKGDAKVAYVIGKDASIAEINPESGKTIGQIGDLNSSHEMNPIEKTIKKVMEDSSTIETDSVGDGDNEFLSGDAMVREREMEELARNANVVNEDSEFLSGDAMVREGELEMTGEGQDSEPVTGSRYSKAEDVISRQDKYFEKDDAGYRITESLEGSGKVKLDYLADYINKSGKSSMLDKLCQVQNDELLERLASMSKEYPDMAKEARVLLNMIHLDEGDVSMVSFNQILASDMYDMDQKLDIFNRPEFFQNEVSMDSFTNAHPEIPFHSSLKKVSENFAQYVTQDENIFKQAFGSSMNINPSKMQDAFNTFLDRSFSSEPITDHNVWHPVMDNNGSIYNVNHYSGPTGDSWHVSSGGGTEFLTEGRDKIFKNENQLLDFLGREKGEHGEWNMPSENIDSEVAPEKIIAPEPVDFKEDEIIPPEPIDDKNKDINGHWV